MLVTPSSARPARSTEEPGGQGATIRIGNGAEQPMAAGTLAMIVVTAGFAWALAAVTALQGLRDVGSQDEGGDENFNVWAVNPADSPKAGEKAPPAKNLTAAQKVLPAPGELSTVISPPWAATISATMARPRPVPRWR